MDPKVTLKSEIVVPLFKIFKKFFLFYFSYYYYWPFTTYYIFTFTITPSITFKGTEAALELLLVC